MGLRSQRNQDQAVKKAHVKEQRAETVPKKQQKQEHKAAVKTGFNELLGSLVDINSEALDNAFLQAQQMVS